LVEWHFAWGSVESHTLAQRLGSTNAAKQVAGSCEAERDDMRCGFERYYADPANAGACP